MSIGKSKPLRQLRWLIVAVLPQLAGCYYMQAVGGQLEIWRKQRPVAEVIADPATDAALVERLETLQAARDFATRELLLPDNGSYRQYADLGREHVLWNVVAAPEFSLQPETWCYLFVGCLAYRGYFDEQDARDFAGRLRRDGYDVFVGGVAAYSTLGRFSDPLLNTMLDNSDPALIGLLFHELAHQKLYQRDATGFNESYASAVAELGLEQWYRGRNASALAGLDERQARNRTMMTRVDAAREALAALYGEALADERKRARKQAILDRLAQELGDLLNEDWSATTLNNARLATLNLYRGQVAAFRQLFLECDADWACFHEQSAMLAARTAAARDDALARLARAAD